MLKSQSKTFKLIIFYSLMDITNIELPTVNKETFNDIPGKLARKFRDYKRVFSITKKPKMEEFKMISKVTALGTLLIGAIGFAVFMIAQFV